MKKGLLLVGNFDSSTGYAWSFIEKFWLLFAEEAAKKNINPHLIYPIVSSISDPIKKSNIHIDEIDFDSKNLKGILKLISKIIYSKITIIYLTDKKTHSIKYILLRLLGVTKIIVHDHAPGLRDKPSGLKRLIKKSYNLVPGMACNAAIAVGPYIATRLSEVNLLPETKIFLVNNGIPDTASEERTRSDDRIRIITVCRMTLYKGIDFSLNVLAKIINDYKINNIEYILVGDGPDLAMFEKMAADLDIANYVSFIGKSNSVRQEIVNSDIAFHPSRGEALSLAILEYMRERLPILVSDNPSVCSILENDKTASIYRENDIHSAAEKLKALIEDKNKRRILGENAQIAQKAQFTENKMYDTFEKVLEKILAR